MDIHGMLSPERIIMNLESSTKRDALVEIVNNLGQTELTLVILRFTEISLPVDLQLKWICNEIDRLLTPPRENFRL